MGPIQPPASLRPRSVAILGTDALVAALPATPVQLAHACHAAGFASVVPASWGDELIAGAVLRALPSFGSAPVIQCSCPKIAHRLLAVGGDLRDSMISLVAPPVALARYLRDAYGPAQPRITYVGRCPAAVDDSIDAHVTPEEFLALLADAGIVLESQPRVFESVIPPDRRRYLSEPGGVPSQAALAMAGSRSLAVIEDGDIAIEVAQLLLTTPDVLIDVGPRLGCACAGAPRGGGDGEARDGVARGGVAGRARVVSIEPPRASSPVIDAGTGLELELPIPAASRAPADAAVRTGRAPSAALYADALPATSIPVVASPPEVPSRGTPPRGTPVASVAGDGRPKHPGAQSRPLGGSAPVAKDGVGRQLPRTYVARRRSSPRGIRRSQILELDTITMEREVPDGRPHAGAAIATPPDASTVSGATVRPLAVVKPLIVHEERLGAMPRAGERAPGFLAGTPGFLSWPLRRLLAAAGVGLLLVVIAVVLGSLIAHRLER